MTVIIGDALLFTLDGTGKSRLSDGGSAPNIIGGTFLSRKNRILMHSNIMELVLLLFGREVNVGRNRDHIAYLNHAAWFLFRKYHSSGEIFCCKPAEGYSYVAYMWHRESKKVLKQAKKY